MIQVTKVKKAFHDENLQVSPDALNMLNEEVSRLVYRWVQNTREGNVKRVTVDTIHITLGRLGRYFR